MYTIEIDKQEKRILQAGLHALIDEQKKLSKEYDKKLSKNDVKELKDLFGVSSHAEMGKRARKLRDFLIYTVK